MPKRVHSGWATMVADDLATSVKASEITENDLGNLGQAFAGTDLACVGGGVYEVEDNFNFEGLVNVVQPLPLGKLSCRNEKEDILIIRGKFPFLDALKMEAIGTALKTKSFNSSKIKEVTQEVTGKVVI